MWQSAWRRLHPRGLWETDGCRKCLMGLSSGPEVKCEAPSPVERGIWNHFQADGLKIASKLWIYVLFLFCLWLPRVSLWVRSDFRLVLSSFPLKFLHQLLFIFNPKWNISGPIHSLLYCTWLRVVCAKYFLNSLLSSSHVSTYICIHTAGERKGKKQGLILQGERKTKWVHKKSTLT